MAARMSCVVLLQTWESPRSRLRTFSSSLVTPLSRQPWNTMSAVLPGCVMPST